MGDFLQRAIPLLLALWLINDAFGSLTWESLIKKGSAEEGENEVVLQFPFRNEGTEMVQIADIRSACGCIAAKASVTTIKPGESGQVTVTFTIGNRVGHQQKVVSVLEDGAGAPTILQVDIQLPEPIKVEPTALVWQKGEKPIAKTIDLTTTDGITVGESTMTNPDFKVTENETPGGRQLTVDPNGATGPISALLRVSYTGKSSGTVSIPIQIK